MRQPPDLIKIPADGRVPPEHTLEQPTAVVAAGGLTNSPWREACELWDFEYNVMLVELTGRSCHYATL